MLTAMAHRGPDGQGLHATDHYALGHLRLAIIDIEGAPQPMWSPSGKVALSFNGEIYNFRELIEVHKRRGWSFRTRSDTETLLSGYMQDGPGFDSTLNGMYAYALLDTREGYGLSGRGRLQLGIDPLGIKPLYVWDGQEALIFASELRGILAGLRALGVAASLDQLAVAQFLAQGWVPQPRSLVNDVRKLPPGARIEVDLATGKVSHLSARPLPEPASGDLETTLTAAVKRQIFADAPLGFFLSGGIDSSLLVSVAQRLGITPRTFTVSFGGDGHGVEAANEAEVARLVAERCGAEHHELMVTSRVLMETLDDTFDAMDQPIADPACLPLLLMARFARQEVKVCLSGDGGDELFQGYPRHRYAAMKARWQQMPLSLRKVARGFSRGLPTAPSRGLTEKLRRLGVGFALIDNPYYVSGPFSGELEALLTQEMQLPDWMLHVDLSNAGLFAADVQGQLTGQMLPKTDHIGMYASLECRVPFLDLEMVALARAIPSEEKRIGGQGKVPLRTLLAKYLPPEVTDRPKRGFRVPLTDWFRHELAGTVRSRLLDPAQSAAGLVHRPILERLLAAHISGRAEHSIRIWALLALQSWLDRHGFSEAGPNGASIRG